MNTFDYRITIDDIPYSISVDATKGDRKRIVVNKTVVYDDICASWMKPRTDIMYFSFSIKNQNIVISIDDRELKYKFNIYINNVSPIDKTNLYDDLNKAKKIIEGGFGSFCKRNWKQIVLKELIWACTWYLGLTFLKYYAMGIETWVQYRLLLIIAAILISPVAVLGEWLYNKDIVKRFKRRFRTKSVVKL